MVCLSKSEVELLSDPGNLTPFPVLFLLHLISFLQMHAHITHVCLIIQMVFHLPRGGSRQRCDTISSKTSRDRRCVDTSERGGGKGQVLGVSEETLEGKFGENQVI